MPEVCAISQTSEKSKHCRPSLEVSRTVPLINPHSIPFVRYLFDWHKVLTKI